ncbi:cation/H(+) antiporter 28-like [Aristolochia californica]|uniref:cation/H(+) antiporter 28-like n=1 Tax=Aristolochia californica TaxID=171875 RepID=UPI0035D8A895
MASAIPDDCHNGYAGSFDTFFVSLLAILFASRLLHFFLKYLGQPRVISEIFVGMVIGNSELINSFDPKLARMVRLIAEYGIMSHFFVLGLGMEPKDLFRKRPTREAVLSTAGIVGTYLLISCIQSIFLKGLGTGDTVKYIISLGLSLSNTSSTVLTRLITDLKIGKSEIGRLAVNAAVHNDMTTMSLMSLFLIMQTNIVGREILFDLNRTFVVIPLLIFQTWFLLNAGKRGMDWVNERNPEGKPMNKWHLFLTILLLSSLCWYSPLMGYNGTLNAFVIGLTLPREGRLSRTLIRKINTWLTGFIFPFYYAFVGSALKFNSWKGWASFKDLCVLVLLAMGGKVVGSVIAAISMGFGFPEALCIGLLLNVKGHYNILAAVNALENGVMDTTAFLINVTTVMITIVYIPLVAVVIVRRARKQHSKLQMALQWQDPASEFRIMTCLHGLHNVPSIINIIEATRGGPLFPRLTAYAVDLVELTSRTAATLTYGQGLDAVDVSDEAVVEMRDQITLAFDAYQQESGEGVSIRRLLVVSSFSSMYLDICNAAQDALTVLVILPFHKKQRVDGTMDDGHDQFRIVNRKVLHNAPCSVGIFVDRGLGASQMTSSLEFLHAAVVFIGGPDDREALSYASRVANYPGVRLTAIRFLQRDDQDVASYPGSIGQYFKNASEQGLMSHPEDDECFSDFYDRHLNSGHVHYIEKFVSNSAETFSSLRALEGQFNFFIVGRGGTPLTAGMTVWEECPELGPLGDSLTSSDFSITASVLVIQQHNPGREKENPSLEDFSLQ